MYSSNNKANGPHNSNAIKDDALNCQLLKKLLEQGQPKKKKKDENMLSAKYITTLWKSWILPYSVRYLGLQTPSNLHMLLYRQKL